MPEPRQTIPDDFPIFYPLWQKAQRRADATLKQDEVLEAIRELSCKIDILTAKLDRVFGNGILINGKWISLKL
jgi:hypothetical protein